MCVKQAENFKASASNRRNTAAHIHTIRRVWNATNNANYHHQNKRDGNSHSLAGPPLQRRRIFQIDLKLNLRHSLQRIGHGRNEWKREEEATESRQN